MRENLRPRIPSSPAFLRTPAPGSKGVLKRGVTVLVTDDGSNSIWRVSHPAR